MATITFLPMLDCQTSRSQRPRFGEPSATTAAILCAESAVDQRLELRVVAQGGEILVLARLTGELGRAHPGGRGGASAALVSRSAARRGVAERTPDLLGGDHATQAAIGVDGDQGPEAAERLVSQQRVERRVFAHVQRAGVGLYEIADADPRAIGLGNVLDPAALEEP